MRDLIATLQKIPGARVDFVDVYDGAVVAECHLPNLPGFEICLSGSPDVLEWHLIIRDRTTKQELWSDWMDYTGYGQGDRSTLTADMRSDIESVLADLRKALDFRIRKEGFNPLPVQSTLDFSR